MGYRIILSKRNLLALLTKLEMADSACTICATCTAGGYSDLEFCVSSEPDEQHYGDRAYPPGRMHPITEAAIVKIAIDFS